METAAFRSRSIVRLAPARIAIPAALPWIDSFTVRPVKDVLDRLLCLNAVTATAYGFDKDSALAWLSREGLLEKLTRDERWFLRSGAGDIDALKLQVEGMWALAWVAGIVSELNFQAACDSGFVSMLPDLRMAESSASFRSRVCSQDAATVGTEVDIAYCLHWALRQAQIHGSPVPAGVNPDVVTERRSS